MNAAGQDAGPCKCDEAIASAGLVFPDVVNVTAVQQRRQLLHQVPEHIPTLPKLLVSNRRLVRNWLADLLTDVELLPLSIQQSLEKGSFLCNSTRILLMMEEYCT